VEEKAEQDGAVVLDGRQLLEQGRKARAERARKRSMRGRIERVLAKWPAAARYAVYVLTGTTALCLLLLITDVAVSFGRIHPGVRVGEVRVGTMAPERAAGAVEEVLAPRLDDSVTVVFESRSWDIEASRIGAELDAGSLVDQAMSVGRTGTLWERAKTRATLWWSPVVLPVSAVADREALDGFLSDLAGSLDREPRDAAVIVEGTEARLESAELGVAVRSDDVAQDILKAFVSTDRVVDVAVDLLPVRVTDEGALQALEDARAMLAGPVTVIHDPDSWEFAADEIAPWVDFRIVPETSAIATSAVAPPHDEGTPSDDTASARTSVDERFVLQAYISAEEASETVVDRVGEAGKPPVDARFKVGGGSVTIIPSEDGVGPDIEALATEMTRVLTTEEIREVQLRTQRIEPELTTEQAEQMGIRERIATYTTNFSSANRPRVVNIQILAKALDGTLVPPGGTFSFNETIGPRTAAKGYQEAPAIVAGRLVPQIGGGICQVGTTLFNTVFESGLPVVERRNHSFYISSYPKGRDATVAWGGPDIKFKNDTDNWVLIATACSDTSVIISLYGTDPGYEVKASVGDFTDIRPFPVKEVPDDTLAAGTSVVEDAGVDGRRVVVKRTVLRDGQVVREDTFTSVYRPKEQVLRVGTKEEEPSVVATGTGTP